MNRPQNTTISISDNLPDKSLKRPIRNVSSKDLSLIRKPSVSARYWKTVVIFPIVSVLLAIIMMAESAILSKALYSSWVQAVALIFTSAFWFWGPFNLVVKVFPVYLAYPELPSFRVVRNRHISETEFLLHISLVTMAAALYITGLLSLKFGYAIVYTISFIAVSVRPLLFREAFNDKVRNTFLLQMEHDEFCCDRAVRFRSAENLSVIDLALLLYIVIRVVIIWAGLVANVDVSLLLVLPILTLIWFIWSERNFHFYRDYSYTFFWTVLPELILSLLISLFKVLQSTARAQDTNQFLWIFIVIELAGIVGLRVALILVDKSAQMREDAVMLLFPLQFYWVLFQYFYLFLVPKDSQITFWVAWSFHFAIAVFDVTGLFSDIFKSVMNAQYLKPRVAVPAYQNMMFQVRSPFVHQMQAPEKYKIADTTSFTISQEISALKILNYERVMYIAIIHQKVLVKFIAAVVAFSMTIMDSYILSGLSLIYPNYSNEICVFFCNLDSSDHEERNIRSGIIGSMYLLISIIAMILTKLRVRRTLGQISVKLESDSKQAGNDEHTDSLSRSLTVGANKMKKLNMRLIQTEDENMTEWNLLLHGHISRLYERNANLIFMICCVVHGCYSLLQIIPD